jgi:hypothetical protein
MGCTVMGMGGLVMGSYKGFPGADISETLRTDIGVAVFTPRLAYITGMGRDMVQTGYTIDM